MIYDHSTLVCGKWLDLFTGGKAKLFASKDNNNNTAYLHENYSSYLFAFFSPVIIAFHS